MLDALWKWFGTVYRGVKSLENRCFRRARRFEHREVKLFLAWIEDTRNLIHLSILLFVPLLIGVVTIISNAVDQLSFLLFPPLAAGTYTLFANPTGRFASPRRFVAGLTIGALCGWAALEIGLYLNEMPLQTLQIDAAGTTLSVLLTGIVTWSLDVEEPAAFSTALLVLVTKTSPIAYVISIFVSSTLVAGVFVVWKRRLYRQRSRYLYKTMTDESRVLVPMREIHQRSTSLLAGRLAGGDSPGEVVLLDVVDDVATAERERDLYEGSHDAPVPDPDDAVGVDETSAPNAVAAENVTPAELSQQHACREAVARLEAAADHITDTLDIPCEVVVAAGSNPATTVLETAQDAHCDMIVTTYEEQEGVLSPFITELFSGNVDVVAHRPIDDRSRWSRILVPVRRGGDVANRLIELASRLAGASGQVSLCHCIDAEAERNRAEKMLSYLVEQFSGNVETRVPRASVDDFVTKVAPQYDLVMLGASTDRSAASQLITPPMFERVADVDCDMAIVHRG